MNISYSLVLLGKLLAVYSAAMFVPLLLALVNQENSINAFALSILITGVLAIILIKQQKPGNEKLGIREGVAVVSTAWILCTMLGALPFLFSGAVPTYIDALFETASGLTTTGASVIGDVEALPLSTILWRSLTHLLGGMGIVVLFIVLLPSSGSGSVQLFNAEVPGPVNERILPRIRDTAMLLWEIYLIFTVLLVLLLWLAGMPLFDAINHSFATIATGGFSVKNASILFYDNVAIEMIIALFMLLSGANFGIYLLIWRKKSLNPLKNSEFKVYLLIVLAAIVLIAGNLWLDSGKPLAYSFRHAIFQVSSIITTTGFASADFDQWPSMSKLILLTLMFVGGCSGSTAGGIKVSRLILLMKNLWTDLTKGLHPHAVSSIRLEGKPVNANTLSRVGIYFFFFIATFVISSICLAGTGLEPFDAMSAVAASLGNVGPGFGLVGPTTTFAGVSLFGKFILTLCMLLGRLEFFTLLLMLRPEFWRPKKGW